MLRAVGMGDDDWVKPQIGVASTWNEITPCNLSLDRLAKAVKNGVHAAGGYPLEFGTISVSDGISMGHEGMHFSLVSREVIADSVETVMMAERLDGSVLLAGLRQVAARHADGRRPARPRLGVPLRRLDHAGPGRRQRRHDHRRLRGRRCLPRRQDHPRGGRPDRAGDLPRRGRLRRDVHRQHDGRRRRGARDVPARLGRAARRRPPPRRVRAPLRRGRRRDAPPGHHRPPDHDHGGLRERDRRGDGARRLHQRRAAPAGDRPRGRGRPDHRRLQPDRRQGAAPRRPQAVRPLRDERRRQDRRHPGGDEGAARRRADARRLPHRHRQDDGREPRGARARPTSTAR